MEIAFAEAFVALALDDLEEDRPDRVLGEDLQQLALLGFEIGIDEDLVLRQTRHVLAVVRHARVDHLEIRVGRVEERDAGRTHGLDGVVDIVGEAGDVLDALAVVLVEVFVDLALRIGGFVERNAHDAVRRGHGLGHEARLGALDVEVADLAEIEQALVVVRPLLHVAEVQIVGQVVDEGQAEAGGVLLGAGDRFEFAIDIALVAVAVDQIQHAVADALDDRRVHGARVGLVIDPGATVADGLLGHPRGRFLHTDREAAGAGSVGLGEIGGEGIRILVHEEVHAALAVQRQRAAAMARHRRETHALEQRLQQRRVGRGELDEFKPVDAHRILELGRLHAEIGLGAHGWLLEGLHR